MRKILLASTALVALGVSAASADISISGSAKWNYTSASSTGDASGDSFAMNNDLTIASSFASDSGLTYGTSHSIDEGGTTDDQKMYVSGSFGEVRFGGSGAGADFDTDAAVTDGESSTATGYSGKAATASSTDTRISYFTPSVNGFSAGISFDDAGSAAGANNDITEMGAKYTQTVGDATVTVAYASRDTSSAVGGANTGSSATSLGATISMGDLSVTVAQNTSETDNGSSKGTGAGFGISYVLSEGLTLKAHTISGEDDADSAIDNTETAASLTYVIAPGLTANVAYTDSEAGTTTSNATTAYVKVAF